MLGQACHHGLRAATRKPRERRGRFNARRHHIDQPSPSAAF
jgi:hypothetical protein